MRKKLCVFGGSKSGKNNENIKSAKIVGQIIAENNFDIVFGGGENGIMGSVSKTARVSQQNCWKTAKSLSELSSRHII